MVSHNRIFAVFAGTALIFSTVFLASCDAKKDEPEPAKPEFSVPAAVTMKIEKTAADYFKDNEFARTEWIRRQKAAYKEIAMTVPDIPLKDFAQVRSSAEVIYPDDYVQQLSGLPELILAVKDISRMSADMSDWEFGYASKIMEEAYPNDPRQQLKFLQKWKEAFRAASNLRPQFEPDVFEVVEKRACETYAENPESVAPYIKKQAEAKAIIQKYAPVNVSSSAVEKAKAALASKYYADFAAQLAELPSAAAKLASAEGAQKTKVGTTDSPDKSEMQKTAEDIFRKSIFTMRGLGQDIYSAALVKMNGKAVILCTKEFIPEKMPAVFGNSAGKITCSKMFVSEDFPIVLMVPDEEPKNFKPLDVVTAADSAALSEKSLLMIAPLGGGFMGKRVSVFSEDLKFLNLTAETAPQVRRTTDLKALDRKAEKLMVSITETVDVGENSVVIDPKSGKLVSMALRIYDPGHIVWGGKTGSVIGHETSEFPDFNTLVAQFDGTSRSTWAKPMSSIRFVRMTAFERWTPVTQARLDSEKTQIRKLTEANNDYLQFFRKNEFNDALQSRRIGTVAEKYRRTLLFDKLDRESFERAYRNYMLGVLYVLDSEMKKLDAESFSSLYRSELKYQLNLQSAMRRYLAEAVKDGNTINILHTDIKSRYEESVNPQRAPAGTSSSGGKTVVIIKNGNDVRNQ